MCMGLWGVGNSGTLTAQKLRWLTYGPQNHSVINWGLWLGRRRGGQGSFYRLKASFWRWEELGAPNCQSSGSPPLCPG